MEKDLSKTGYIILFVGLGLIFTALTQITLVILGIIKPFSLFSFKASDFAIDGGVLFPQLPSTLTRDLKVELFPADFINGILNLSANTLLIFIFIFAGFKVASIGVQLLRPIYIKSKND